MAKKRKTLPKEIDELLKIGDVEELKKVFSRCEPNAQRYGKYGSNIFSRTPLPEEDVAEAERLARTLRDGQFTRVDKRAKDILFHTYWSSKT